MVTVGRPELDLIAAKPDVIASCAVYTAINKAERETDLAYAINGVGAGAGAAAAKTLGIPIIPLSTDYVFDGNKQGGFRRGDLRGTCHPDGQDLPSWPHYHGTISDPDAAAEKLPALR